ncbi:MAG TPA: hypothetical protein VGQ39_18390 [Pyrinomonadaceae bacterium]|jgi:hypothetical protein|nr:hypothetical protein [Pyrinomonadaceae bacterium]
MKKTLVRKKKPAKQDTMSPEYRFDYSKSKPNRFAAKMSADTVAVVLEPEVAAVFRSSEDVSALLRSIISAMPSSRRTQGAKERRRTFIRLSKISKCLEQT